MTIISETRIQPGPEVVACQLDDEQVLLNLTTGNYYVLNSTGHHVWSLIGEATTFSQVFRAMANAYEVEEGALRNELTSLLEDLSSKGLVALA